MYATPTRFHPDAKKETRSSLVLLQPVAPALCIDEMVWYGVLDTSWCLMNFRAPSLERDTTLFFNSFFEAKSWCLNRASTAAASAKTRGREFVLSWWIRIVAATGMDLTTGNYTSWVGSTRKADNLHLLKGSRPVKFWYFLLLWAHRDCLWVAVDDFAPAGLFDWLFHTEQQPCDEARLVQQCIILHAEITKPYSCKESEHVGTGPCNCNWRQHLCHARSDAFCREIVPGWAACFDLFNFRCDNLPSSLRQSLGDCHLTWGAQNYTKL